MNSLGPIRVVLLATDLSQKSHMALEYAVACSEACHARLILAHALDPASEGGLAETSASELRELTQSAQAELSSLLGNRPGSPNLETQVVVRYGNPRDVIFQLQRELSADLVVLGSGGKTGGPRSPLGSVAEALLRSLPCRVLTLGPQVRPPEFPAVPRSLLLPTDFQPWSLAALPAVRALVEQFPARLILFHICTPGEHHRATNQEELCTNRLAELARSLAGQSFAAESFLHAPLQANVPAQICTFADERRVSLIIMGVRNGNLATGERLHGTTAQVIREAHCPVLTIAAPARA